MYLPPLDNIHVRRCILWHIFKVAPQFCDPTLLTTCKQSLTMLIEPSQERHRSWCCWVWHGLTEGSLGSHGLPRATCPVFRHLFCISCVVCMQRVRTHNIFQDLPCLSLPVLCMDMASCNLRLLFLLTTPHMLDVA